VSAPLSLIDFQIENHGSIWLVRPMTTTCREWLEENTEGMWFGGALAVEPRYVADLVAGMEEEGFVNSVDKGEKT